MKMSTGIDKLVAVFASSGRKLDAILGTNGTDTPRQNAPTAPAIKLTINSRKRTTALCLRAMHQSPFATRFRAVSR